MVKLMIPLSPKMLSSPINPYGKTKAYIESLLFDLNQSNNKSWKIRILRYFNPVGAMLQDFGEQTTGNNDNLFPVLCDVAIGMKQVLEIYGNDWQTKDGTCVEIIST